LGYGNGQAFEVVSGESRPLLASGRGCQVQLSRRTLWISAALAALVAIVVLAVVYGGGGGGGGGY